MKQTKDKTLRGRGIHLVPRHAGQNAGWVVLNVLKQTVTLKTFDLKRVAELYARAEARRGSGDVSSTFTGVMGRSRSAIATEKIRRNVEDED